MDLPAPILNSLVTSAKILTVVLARLSVNRVEFAETDLVSRPLANLSKSLAGRQKRKQFT